jgi:hypothetical protein
MVARSLGFRLRRWIASHVSTIVVLAVAVAVVSAAVLALAAGARRTQTAPDRYQDAFGGGHDLSVAQNSGPPTTDLVAGLPAVEQVQSVTFLFYGGIVADSGVEIDALPFAGSVGGFEARVIEGREPDPSSIHEFVSTEAMVRQSGMAVGDTAHFFSQTPESGDRFGFDVNHLDGPQWDAELVGIIESASELEDPSTIILFSSALLDGRIHNESTLMLVDLVDGATEADLRQQLDTSIPDADFTIEPAITIGEEIRTAVRGQAIGLWVLAALSAVAAVAALGHLLARSVRVGADEQRTMSALGWTRSQIVGESTARATVITSSGLAVALLLAVAGSWLFPFGFAREVEPSAGVRIEPLVLIGAAAVLAVLITMWVAIAAAADLRRASNPLARVGAAGTLAALAPSATAATGLRFAFARRGGDAVPLSAAVGGTVLSVAFLVGTLTFGLSLSGLVDDGVRYGENFDAAMDNGADVLNPDLLQLAIDTPTVSDIELFRAAQARVDTATLPILTSESVRGEIDPVLLAGREPSGPDEIALGSVAARHLGSSIGDTVTVSSRDADATLDVVGIAVLPGIRGYDLLGENAYVAVEAFDALFPGTQGQVGAVRFADGVDADAELARIAQLLERSPDELVLAPPAAISNLRYITFVPYVLASLLLALAAISLIGALWSGARRSEHQAAVLRALGADRAWLRRAGVWQAVVFTAVPALIGAFAGVIAGRLVYRNFAETTGVVDSVDIPWAYAAAALVGLIILAVVTTWAAGRRARVARPASMLRVG